MTIDYYLDLGIFSPLYCLDWEIHADELALWGKFYSTTYQSISINLVPCNFVYPGLEEHYPIAEGCIKDEK